MKTKHITLGVLIALIILGAFLLLHPKESAAPSKIPTSTTPTANVLSFEDCKAAGYPVLEGAVRQCKTPDGRTYAEEILPKITYSNASVDLIKIDTPFPGAVTGKEFSVKGSARGTWFFEASFPVELRDANNVVIASGPAHADGDWMTENFVPFSIDLKVPDAFMGKATLYLRKDNPSGLPENEASASFPITVEY